MQVNFVVTAKENFVRFDEVLEVPEVHYKAIVDDDEYLLDMTGSGPDGRSLSNQQILEDEWHAEMVNKYRRAARYPWLPMVPDPPEPR